VPLLVKRGERRMARQNGAQLTALLKPVVTGMQTHSAGAGPREGPGARDGVVNRS